MFVRRLFVLSVCGLLAHSNLSAADKDLGGANVSPEDCGEVRLDAPSQPLADGAIRDQGTLGSCSAHTAAILIDAHLATKFPPPDLRSPPKHRTSPLSLYIRTLDATGKKGEVSGDVGVALAGALSKGTAEKGSCDLGDENYEKLGQTEFAGRLKTYREQLNFSAETQDKTMVAAPAAAVPYNSPTRQKEEFESIFCLASKFFNVPSELIDANAAAALLQENDQVKFWRLWIDAKCERDANGVNRTVSSAELNLPEVLVYSRRKVLPKEHSQQTVAQLQKKMDENLTASPPQPIGITYCSSALRKKPGTIVDPIVPANDNTCALHASAVVGRQWRKGTDGVPRCMYLVQNSWGSGKGACQQYHADRRKIASGTTDENIEGDCENGKIWISQAELKNVSEVTFLKKSGD